MELSGIATTLLLLSLPSIVRATLVEAPVSYNASLGSTAQFHCELSMSGTLYWLLNYHEMWESSNSHRQAMANTINGQVSTLRVAAIMANDNLTIHCVANGVYAEPVKLRVQGLLSAPSNASVQQLADSTIVLSWNPPPTLDLTDVTPDILHYIVMVSNNHTGYQSTATVNQTEYQFQPVGSVVDEFTEYAFTISAVNVVGVGDPSSANYRPRGFLEPSLSMTTIDDTTGAQNTPYYTCTSTAAAITWIILNAAQEPQADTFQDKAGIWCSFNSTTNGYSETIDLSPWIHVNNQQDMDQVSIQCVASRVCGHLEGRPCRNFTCRSKAVSMLANVTADHASACKPIIIAVGATGLAVICLLLTVIIVIALGLYKCHSPKKIVADKGGQEPEYDVIMENRIYDSPQDIITHELTTYNSHVSTEVCPAYQTIKTRKGS